jgi:hypothetical protein
MVLLHFTFCGFVNCLSVKIELLKLFKEAWEMV